MVLREAWTPGDAIGFAVAHARFGGPARRVGAAEVPPAETAVEATYLMPLGRSASLQPNLQSIRRPGGGAKVRDAVVVGLRVSIEARFQ